MRQWDRSVEVAFRFDDPSALSDHVLERKIIEAFAKEGIPLTVAAVPFAVDPLGQDVPLTRQTCPHLYEGVVSGTVEIALHGHSHLKREDALGEFAGVPYETQYMLLQKGMEQLRKFLGKNVSGFVPPWNLYDEATLGAMSQTDLEYLSAGTRVRVRRAGLSVIPGNSRLWNVEQVLKQALRFRHFMPVVVVIFHPQDFKEHRSANAAGEDFSRFDLALLERLLRWVATQRLVSPVHLSKLAQNREKYGELIFLSELEWVRVLPMVLSRRLPRKLLVRSQAAVGLPGFAAALSGMLRSWLSR